MPPLDPMSRFGRFLLRARRNQPEEVSDAMTLSTADAEGRPRSRIVLLRGFDERGFVFYTNLQSAKGTEIERSNRVALCFHWAHMSVQVRVEGAARPVSAAEADAYFASRARNNQLAAWASDQSRPLKSRARLILRFGQAMKRFAGGPVPRPPHWSGFRVVPDAIEFWQGRPGRLHDRERFTRRGGAWEKTRLYP